MGSAQGVVKLSCYVFSVPEQFSLVKSFQVLACFYTGFKRLMSMSNKDFAERLSVDVADSVAVKNSTLT